MTITQFLALFPLVNETTNGWNVCCPAHDDHDPSLGILEGDEGRIVVNCFAGCTTQDICTALGLQLSDLFAETRHEAQIAPVTPPPKKISRVKLAFRYELHAFDLRQQSDKILAVAAQCEDCDTWTDEDRELAMQAVARAYQYRDRATFCESYADHLREQHHESTRATSREPNSSRTSH